MPALSDLVMRNSFENIDFTKFATTPMALVIYTLLKVVPSNTVPNNVRYFCKKHRKETNLVDKCAWDRDVAHWLGIELLLFSKHRDHFFN